PRASFGQRRLDPRQLLVPLEQRFGGHGHVHVPPAYSPCGESHVCRYRGSRVRRAAESPGVSTVRHLCRDCCPGCARKTGGSPRCESASGAPTLPRTSPRTSKSVGRRWLTRKETHAD